MSRTSAPHRPAEAEPANRSTSEVLLQVILPIVLILAFFAMSSVRSFERKEEQLRAMLRDISSREATLLAQRQELDQASAAVAEREQAVNHRREQVEERSRQLDAWWQEVTRTEPAALGLQLSEVYIELQKQRLVAALEVVENRQRMSLGLPVLSAREFRADSSGQVVDEGAVFGSFCRQVEAMYRDGPSRAGQRDRLVGLVLTEAGLEGPGGDVSGRPTEPGRRTVLDGHKARRGEVTAANLAFLRHQVDKILADLRDAAAYQQLRAINGVFTHYQEGPPAVLYQWIPALETMRDQLVTLTRAGGDVGPLEIAIRRTMYRQLQADFEALECRLLPEVTEYP